MKRLLIILLVLAITAPLFATGGAQEGQASTGGQRVVTNVTPQPLAVQPLFDMGDSRWHPQPATSYWTNPQYPRQPPVSNKNGFPIVQQPVSVRIAHPYYSYVLDYYDNDLVRHLERLTNVRIEWDLLPEVNAMDRVNLMFASGEHLPDAFLSAGFTAIDLVTLGSGGLIIPTAQLVEDNSYHFQELITRVPAVWASSAMADGNVYSFASYGVNTANQLAMRFWINQNFLDALNMPTPTTTEEYYNYLIAVRDRNPNGLGPGVQEIPLVAATDGWHPRIDGFLMMPFIYNDQGGQRYRMFTDDRGRIDVSYNKPAYRQGLEYLNRLFRENLMFSEVFTLNRAGMIALVENPAGPIVGSLPSGGPHEFANTGGDRRTHYRALPPLRGPTGIRQAWWEQFAGIGIGFFVISKDATMPDVLAKWIDYWYTPDVSTYNRYGILGRDWLLPPPGTPAVSGGQAMYEEVLRWGTPQNVYLGRGSGQGFFQSYDRAVGEDPFELEAVLWAARQLYTPFRFELNVPQQLTFTVDEARDFNQLHIAIRDYVDQSMAQFVSGGTALNDANWNAYTQQIDRMGVANLLRLAQTAFDRTWASALGFR